jgi:hypothetical protein
MAMSTVRIGVLGAARIAPAALIRPARVLDGVQVTAVAARDPNRAVAFAAKHGIATVHDSYDALLADPAHRCHLQPATQRPARPLDYRRTACRQTCAVRKTVHRERRRG